MYSIVVVSPLILLMIDKVVSLRALETSAFIIARPTEGSSYELFAANKYLLSAATVLANHSCCGKWWMITGDVQVQTTNMGTPL